MLFYFSKGKYADKSSKDLKELIEQYKELDDALNKIIFNWHKEHNIDPSCFTISDYEVININ